MRYRASASAYELIERFEGFEPRARRLTDGRWTIGYGHTLTAREGAGVSKADAEALLLYDLRPVVQALNDLIFTPLTQNQFDALAAFVFNIGIEAFSGSAVLRQINAGALHEVVRAMEMWRRADLGGQDMVVDALMRRRAAEKALFLTPTDGWIPAPTPILRPRLDQDLASHAAMAEDEAAPASRAAFEAMSERLSAILPDEPDASPSVAAQISEDEETASFAPAPTLEMPPPEAEPTPETSDSGAGDPESALLFPSHRVAWRETPKQAQAARRRAGEAQMPLALVALLFVLGAVLFAGAAYLALNLKMPAPGWGVGGLGAICLAVSVYAGLRRLGDRDD